MIRLLVEICALCAIIYLFAADLDGKSVWRTVNDKGLKYTIERVWEGPKQ